MMNRRRSGPEPWANMRVLVGGAAKRTGASKASLCSLLHILCSVVSLAALTAPSAAETVFREVALLSKAATFECSVQSPDSAAEVDIWWQAKGKNLTNTDRMEITVSKSADGNVTSNLSIRSVSWEDEGVYSCVAVEKSDTDGTTQQQPSRQDILLDILAAPKHYEVSNGQGRVEASSEMSCSFKAKPTPKISWFKFGNLIEQDLTKYEITTEKKSDTEIKSYLKILSLHHDDNGTFLCQGDNEHGSDIAIVHNIVFDRPAVKVEFVKAVSKDKIYLNWTTTEWNSPVLDYFLSYRQSGGSAWVYFITEKIDPSAHSFVMRDLQTDTDYHVKLAAKNKYGMGEFDQYHEAVRTLDFDPLAFVPEVRVKGLTWNSISIGWNEPEEERVSQHIDYYKLTRVEGPENGGSETNMYHPADRFAFYLWRHLSPATRYSFTVAACSDYTRECGAPSTTPVSAATEDGLAGPPSNVEATCRRDIVSGMNFVEVRWDEPQDKFGTIEYYNVQLRGDAKFRDDDGEDQVEFFGPEVKTEDAKSLRTKFDFLKANTNYSVEVCAVTRRKECGQKALDSCAMPQTPPRADNLARFRWRGDTRNGHAVFRMRAPRLGERNGRICCLRVVVVRLRPGEGIEDLPHQSLLSLTSYRAAHDPSGSGGGAYVAEILGSNFLGRDVVIGDGQNILSARVGEGCPACQTGVRSHLLQAARTAERRSSRRSARRVGGDTAERASKREAEEVVPPRPAELVEDGYLDPESNYTAFVELVVPGSLEVGRTPYMSPRKPGQGPDDITDGEGVRSTAANVALVLAAAVLAGLVLVALCLLVALAYLRRYSKKVAATQGGVEMNIRRSFRHFCSTLRHGGSRATNGGPAAGERLIAGDDAAAAKAAELGPIPRDSLVAEYLERHRDSDYGFQAEFELLPDRLPDRTTEACDAPCNRVKNRYPDIKCYDQTRVKLSKVEDREGSDYINANFVEGYKDRKKWICAQGPLEHTVADFWRMVHEQKVDIIIMLTNLEEYNRIKCAQYWPQAGDSNYCTEPIILNVGFCTETRYSDYIVRELRLRAIRGESKEERKVLQFHYLQWKDFNAPEHAPGMLKFAKRINEAWAKADITHPAVVHCSAGVGRSGTLIAIDWLAQQLDEEGKVAIYRTVCGLRRNRNYLVQSVKQYMFVYRAIMEHAQFGDTEEEAAKIKKRYNDLTSKGMEEEYQRLSNIVDDRKALSVGTNEENKLKNQCSTVIPFDRNRVILTPDGLRPHSTYINASFIEGYHNDESFIITQDPMPSTAEDFWRMVTEHSVSTMVMLSGDKAWKYWREGGEGGEREGDAISFGSLKVTLISKEKLTSYVKREFKVLNTKVAEEIGLTHFEYSSWTGDAAEDVPSSTHGILDLVEHATAHRTEAGLTGPIAVHCRRGSDRSSVYVALSCLVLQIKNESRADVFTVVRKLRTQRQGMVQSLSQYKFIYRAIADYVDLYRNKDEEYEYSVPVNAVNGGANKPASK